MASAKGKNWKEELLLEKRRRKLKSVGWKMNYFVAPHRERS